MDKDSGVKAVVHFTPTPLVCARTEASYFWLENKLALAKPAPSLSYTLQGEVHLTALSDSDLSY